MTFVLPVLEYTIITVRYTVQHGMSGTFKRHMALLATATRHAKLDACNMLS